MGTVSMAKKVRITVFICLVLVLGISTALLAYLHFFASGDRDLSGEWTADLDMTEQAAVAAFVWLQDIEAVTISLEDMESYLGDLTVRIDLTMDRTSRFEGNFRCNIQADSYAACNQAAYEAFATAFRELLGERLRMAGYEDGTDQEAVEALVAETFGMSTVSYLMSCGPALLPPLEDLQAQYDGSGTFEAAEGILIRQFDDDGISVTRQERYIKKDFELILLGEIETAHPGPDQYPMVYTLSELEN